MCCRSLENVNIYSNIDNKNMQLVQCNKCLCYIYWLSTDLTKKMVDYKITYSITKQNALKYQVSMKVSASR